MWRTWIAAGFACLAALCLGCGGSKAGGVIVVGSTSVQPMAEMLAQEFDRQNPDAHVEVQGGGSTAGIQALANGIADIGMCSRSLKPNETGFTPITIARDGLVVVVHLTNRVNGLSRQQVREVFEGKVRNWREVGGDDREITLVTREEGSGTREAFEHLVMGKARIARTALTQESNGTVRELVKHDPGAVGYMSLGLVHGEVKALRIDGVAPTAEEVIAGRYPLVRPFLFLVKGAPCEAAEKFIEYVLSPPAQAMLEEEGLVRVK